MGAGVAGACLMAWLTALSVYDVRYRRLPNWLTLPGAVAILITATAADRGPEALLGACALFGVYLAVHVMAPGALGAGDVKLALGVGALTGCLGLDVWVLGALGAACLTALIGLLSRTKGPVPHGLSMCLAAGVGTLVLL
jgi:leader peptidase (prepilin peptidase)/N-methyltransferase